jgi:hypothetical protein
MPKFALQCFGIVISSSDSVLGPLAQWIEQPPSKRSVTGSNPVGSVSIELFAEVVLADLVKVCKLQ